jgi:hypothetical protein
MLRYIINFILSFSLCAYVNAQQVQFSVSADKDSILIGDHINLILKAELDKSIKFTLPALADTFNNFEIVERAGVDTTLTSNKISLQQYIVVTSFDSGQQVIPPLQLLYSLPEDTTTRFAFSEAIRIDVLTVAVVDEEIRDIKDPVKVPLTFAEILPYLLGFIPLLLLLWVIYYWYKNKGKMKMRETPVIRISPYEEARENLHKLEQEKLWQKGEVKKYHSAITDILRNYLERRFYFNAMEQTTDEILFSLSNYEEAQGSEIVLMQILTTADLVKFAKFQPLPDENSLSMKNAFQFIEMTKPAPVEAPLMKGGTA